MESSKGDLTLHPTEDIARQIHELDSTSVENRATRVISVPRISMFGEADHILRPRGMEMVDRAKLSHLPPTHFILEMTGDRQHTIDRYLGGELDSSRLRLEVSGLRQSDLDILSYAKENGIKVIAGDMTREEMERWLIEHQDIVRNAKQSTNSPIQAARVLGVLMEKERSFVTGKKIKHILSTDEHAEIWVNCGALHVANILKGIYLEETDLNTQTHSNEQRNLSQSTTPKIAVRDTVHTSPWNDSLSVIDANPFAIVTQKAETDPDLIILKGTLDEIMRTPIIANSHLIQKAIGILDASKGKLSDAERASIYLGLYYRCTSALSQDQRPLVNKVMDSVDVLDLDVNQKLQGLSKILSGTSMQQRELLQDILTRIDRYIRTADSEQVLTQLHSTLRFVSGSLSKQLQERIQSRLRQVDTHG